MNWDQQLIKACTETDGTPHPHTDHVLTGAKWQRDQLRTDEAVERLANALCVEEEGMTLAEHEANCERPICGFRQSFLADARRNITALLGEDYCRR